MMTRTRILSTLMFVCVAVVRGQDSVDVTFRYLAPGKTGVAVPGEFNGWNASSAPMTDIGGGVFVRTVRLRIGGNPNPPAVGVPGAWQYKFWYSGVGSWPSDPLNHHQNASDNNNSFLYTRNPTIYQLLPNQRNPIVATPTPTISAFLFPKLGTVLDTSTISLTIDGAPTRVPGTAYNFSSKQLQYTPSVPLTNGEHIVILRAGASADTVMFSTRAGYIQITTRGGFTTYDSWRSLRGIVQDTSVKSVAVVRNGTDTSYVVPVSGAFSVTDSLEEGTNTFVAWVDSAGQPAGSASVTITRKVVHKPFVRVAVNSSSGSVTFDARLTHDPDGQTVSNFIWLDDPLTPLGLNGRTGSTVSVAKPSKPGEYYYGVTAIDQDGNADTARFYIVVRPDGSVENPAANNNPAWARAARIYFMFPKAMTSEGTINAAAQHLPRIRDLGFSVIWMMPVMKNASPINNGFGPGYNIVDFETVAPEYGTNQDFRNFVSQAHALGLKVILDVTPNHTGRMHPWSVDGHTYGQDSRYWDWYEHTLIQHNTNGLGQSFDAAGFTYYSGFSEQLLNFNWRSVDARMEMIRIYVKWIKDFDIDGYRFDVYWGPHRRYGEQYMGYPVRQALKHVKPEILILGEDDGTGAGTETIYADVTTGGFSGGVDAGYDFKLYFNRIQPFGFTSAWNDGLHSELNNGGYYPGEHALYMRFMESQDEDRIVYFYSSNFTLDAQTTFQRTMPMATVIFTAPGIPMLWNGQEVGWGYGITGAKEARNRSVINWNYQGRGLLSPHYQKLAALRGQFPAFTQHKRDTNGDGQVNTADSSDFVRVLSSSAEVYAFSRPFENQNGLTAVNFTATSQTFTLDLTGAEVLKFSGGIQAGTEYYLNDLYGGSQRKIVGAGLNAVSVTLPPYGSAVFTVSLTSDTLKITNPGPTSVSGDERPATFSLEQNYPNPFNPSTVVSCQFPVASDVRLVVYDLLGREVAVLMDGWKEAGSYQIRFDGSRLASGMYVYRLTAGQYTAARTMMLVK
jgi:cyclomaltodextrinase / maltogenic alpha-amylase / neopullulanase